MGIVEVLALIAGLTRQAGNLAELVKSATAEGRSLSPDEVDAVRGELDATDDRWADALARLREQADSE